MPEPPPLPPRQQPRRPPDAASAKAHARALRKESGDVWAHIQGPDYGNGLSMGGVVDPDFNVEADFKKSATDISDNTHIGQHWDGPKRGRIIREYRRALDQCNISGNGKCAHDELRKNYPDNK